MKEHAEDIYRSLLGLIVDKCQSAWKSKKPVELTKEPFANLLNAEINKINRKKFIDQPMLKTSYKDYLDKDDSNHTFIAQLQHIGVNVDACNYALSNYWAFYAEKVRLEDSGEVPLSAWEDRNDELYQRWQNIKFNNFEPEVGSLDQLSQCKQIYKDTVNPDYRASLNGQSTINAYFTIGNYHFLANYPENEFFIQWHDNFIKLKGK